MEMGKDKGVSLALIALLLGIILYGCGGGDGKGNSSGGHLSVSRSSIDFASTQYGSTPISQTVTASVTEQTSIVYLGVYYTDSAIDSVTYDLNSSTIPITVHPKSPSSLVVGVHTDEITVLACSDQYCDSHLSGSPFIISVSYTVTGELSASPSNLVYKVTEGSEDSSQNIGISGVNAPWTASIRYGNTSGWLSVLLLYLPVLTVQKW
ncbi:MAG: hypothetical protein P8171_19435 [Candidatus Thiodiazotropha sp.]